MGMPVICECCGQAVPGKGGVAFDAEGLSLVVGGIQVSMTPFQSKLFEYLWSRYPHIARKENIHNHLYWDDVDGGPDPECINVYIYKLRKILKPHNIEIKLQWGVGYSLVISDE